MMLEYSFHEHGRVVRSIRIVSTAEVMKVKHNRSSTANCRILKSLITVRALDRELTCHLAGNGGRGERERIRNKGQSIITAVEQSEANRSTETLTCMAGFNSHIHTKQHLFKMISSLRNELQ